jgi:hypothetical protein
MSCEHLKHIVRWPCTLRKTWTVAGNLEGKLQFRVGLRKTRTVRLLATVRADRFLSGLLVARMPG